MATLIKLVLTWLILSLSVGIQAQGIDFFKGTFAEAKEKAAEEDKLLFVDAYAVWCGPCKRLAAYVFPDEQVGDFYNSNFINLKMDAEKGEGIQFKKQYKVTAYPTIFFMDSEGKVVHKFLGGRDVNGLIIEGQKALDPNPKETGLLKQNYNSGNRNTGFLKKYLERMYLINEPYDGALEAYMNALTEEELATEENMMLIFDLTNSLKSPGYPFIQKDEPGYIEMVSKDSYLFKMETIAYHTMKIAARSADKDLLQSSLDLLKAYKIKDYKRLQQEYALMFYRISKDWESYANAAVKYVKKYEFQEADLLVNRVKDFNKNLKNSAVYPSCEPWAAKAAELKGNYETVNLYARVLYRLKKYEESLEQAKRAKELAAQENIKQASINKFINTVQGAIESEGTVN